MNDHIWLAVELVLGVANLAVGAVRFDQEPRKRGWVSSVLVGAALLVFATTHMAVPA